MNFPAASSGASIGNHLNRPKGRGIKPLSASGGLVRLWRIEDVKACARYATVSIASNIAEGDERDTDKDAVRFFYMAKGSLAGLPFPFSPFSPSPLSRMSNGALTPSTKRRRYEIY